MKKLYAKPEIVFESFVASTSIAAGCEFITNLQAEGTCGYLTRNGVVFMETISGCIYKEPDTNDRLCYHVPVDTANIFNS